MARSSKPAGRVCSVADALAVVGDRYSLLIVREIGYGFTRFNEMVDYTGAPRDVVSSRLKRLEAIGVLERRPYSEHPPRHEYGLTEMGEELRPIVLALKEWGDRCINRDREPVVFEHSCGNEFHPVTTCESCGRPVRPGELRVVGGTHPIEGDPW